MTGKEHYEEAERLLREAETPFIPSEDAMVLLTAAKVHASLAAVQAMLILGVTGIPTSQADGIWHGWGEEI